MSYEIKDVVGAAFDDNTSAFQDTITSILGDKLRERIGVEKVAVAQSMFSEPEEAPDESELEDIEDYSDEDI